MKRKLFLVQFNYAVSLLHDPIMDMELLSVISSGDDEADLDLAYIKANEWFAANKRGETQLIGVICKPCYDA